MLDTAPSLIPEKVTTIKPSEAIRLGRLIYPNEAKGFFFDAPTKRACTLGAMMVALALHTRSNLMNYYHELPIDIFYYLNAIPNWYDAGVKTEQEIIAELEAQGW